jgi:DNA end-binding protein Ku
MEEGLMAHTLHEDRDLNSPKELFQDLAGVKIDPEMVQLAAELIERQSGKYDSGDLEDRYETRLRALIDAKLKGEGLDTSADVPDVRTGNVVDLMAALKKSLGQEPAGKPATAKRTSARATRPAAAQAAKASRKRA